MNIFSLTFDKLSQSVSQETNRNPLSDRVAESHKDRCEESRNRSDISSQWIFFKLASIIIPTIIKIGAVAAVGTIARSGLKKLENRKTDSYNQGCQTSTSTCTNTSSRFNISRYVRSTSDGTNEVPIKSE